MRKFLINSGISIFSFALCMAAAEFFFRYNAVYNWIERPHSHLQHEELPAGEVIPKEVLDATKKSFPGPPQTDSKTYEAFKSRSSEIRYVRSKDYKFPGTFLNLRPVLASERVMHEAGYLGDTELFNATYTFDLNRVRKSSNKPYDKTKKNLLMLGCSYTFGQSVSDHQTIPAFLVKDFPSYNVYNLGVPNNGIAGILDDIYYGDRIKAISKNGGAAIYTYFFDHLRRHFSLLDSVRNPSLWRGVDYHPEAGKLTAKERFFAKVLRDFGILKLLAKSELLFFTGWGYESKSQAQQNQFLDYLVFIRDFYKTEYNLDFYIYFLNPGDGPSVDFYQQLAARKLNVIMPVSIETVFAPEYLFFAADGHFTPMGNDLVGRIMAHRLRRDGF